MRTLVVGAAIVDLMMKIDRLPKSGEDIPCRETKTVVGGCAYKWQILCETCIVNMICVYRSEPDHLQILSAEE